MRDQGGWEGGHEPGGASHAVGWQVPSDPRAHPQTPGQLRAEALTRAHALAVLVDEVGRTSHDLAACRDDPSWSGRAHDAFIEALDDLAGRVALAARLIRDTGPAGGPATGCRA